MLGGLSGCAWVKSSNTKTAQFDTNPNHFKTAQLTPEVAVPKYLADNIEKQPLYPIPKADGLGGDLNATPVPPNLIGKITD